MSHSITLYCEETMHMVHVSEHSYNGRCFWLNMTTLVRDWY